VSYDLQYRQLPSVIVHISSGEIQVGRIGSSFYEGSLDVGQGSSDISSDSLRGIEPIERHTPRREVRDMGTGKDAISRRGYARTYAEIFAMIYLNATIQ
jgi:hypothetical protein